MKTLEHRYQWLFLLQLVVQAIPLAFGVYNFVMSNFTSGLIMIIINGYILHTIFYRKWISKVLTLIVYGIVIVALGIQIYWHFTSHSFGSTALSLMSLGLVFYAFMFIAVIKYTRAVKLEDKKMLL